MPEQQPLDAFAGPTCPTCGRNDFASEQGMKMHHAKAHGESIAGVEIECDHCGETFRRKKAVVERDGARFCSEECSGAWKSETGCVRVTCAYCGEALRRRKSVVEQYENQFCSKECEGAWRSEMARVRVTCTYCGETFRRKKDKAERSDSSFCSPGCYHAWQSENWMGENHPSWRGGYGDYYGPSWYSQRRVALDRADEACEICGLSRDGHDGLYDEDLHVHHKVPFRVFGVENHEQANALDNLIAVCRSCHGQLEPVSQERAAAVEVSAADD